jgi:hypothetical protein
VRVGRPYPCLEVSPAPSNQAKNPIGGDVVVDVQEILKAENAAWNSHDVDMIADFYTDDCIKEDVAVGVHAYRQFRGYRGDRMDYERDLFRQAPRCAPGARPALFSTGCHHRATAGRPDQSSERLLGFCSVPAAGRLDAFPFRGVARRSSSCARSLTSGMVLPD